ncbi:MAG TPA: hypothetical protein VGM39_03925 [Kofleriaceae bacterium]|jgi:hypothetical protein
MKQSSVGVLVVASFLGACGGGGGSDNVDARPTVDAAPPRPCTAPATGYGSPTPTDQSATHFPTDADGYESYAYDALLNNDAMPDGLIIGLFNMAAPFDTTIMPTTIALTGDQASYETCAACVEIDTDYDADGDPTDVYFANGGNLILSSITGMFTGTISNATFVHAIIDNDTYETTPDPDGCVTTISSLSFNIATEEDPGDLRSRKHQRKHHH